MTREFVSSVNEIEIEVEFELEIAIEIETLSILKWCKTSSTLIEDLATVY